MTRTTFAWTLVWIAAFAALGGEYILLTAGSLSDRFPYDQLATQPHAKQAGEVKPINKADGIHPSTNNRAENGNVQVTKPATQIDYPPHALQHKADLRQPIEQAKELQGGDSDAAKPHLKNTSAARAPLSAVFPRQTGATRRHSIRDRDGYVDLTNLSVVCFTRDGRPVCGRSDAP